MLKEILSISGKPGLYRLVSQAKNMLIVKSLKENTTMPVYARDQVISLGDIAIYTTEDEKPLFEIFQTIGEKYELKTVDINIKDGKELQKFFSDVLPNYDKDRVYNGDIKKIVNWYNTLINSGITDFSIKEDEKEEKTEENEQA